MSAPPIELSPAQRSAFRAALAEFDARSVQRGREFAQDFRVKNVAAVRSDPALGFTGDVQGSSRYRVEWLWRSKDETWDHECTCPVGYACEHAYALAQVLLRGQPAPAAARETIAVASPTPIPQPPGAPVAPAEETELVRLLEGRHRRALTKTERQLARELVELWKKCGGPLGSITAAQLVRVGFASASDTGSYQRPGGVVVSNAWDADDAPHSPLLFWNYLAHFASERGLPLPLLFQPVTDPTVVRDRLAARRRRQEVRRWTTLLTDPLPPVLSAGSSAPSGKLPDLAGRSFREGGEPLHWRGRPDPDRADSVVLELVRADGSPVTADAFAPGNGEGFALPPFSVLTANATRVSVPREVFRQPAVARRLRKLGLRLEGVEVPAVNVVELFPRLVCRSKPAAESATTVSLSIELHAVSSDGMIVQRRSPQGQWASLPGRSTATAGQLPTDAPPREFDYERAEAAVGFLDDPRINPAGLRWEWPLDASELPTRFAPWAERVRAAGIEIEAAPELAGLTRPADRARYEFAVRAVTDGEERARIDWFDVEVALRAEDTTLAAEEVALLLKARGGFVQLPGKGWRRLQVAADEAVVARAAELGLDLSRLESGVTRQRFHALQLADESIAGLLPEALAAPVRERAKELAAIPAPSVPAELHAELRPYQRDGFHFLAHLSANGLGGVLADDMRLGKTVQALAWLLHLSAAKSTAATGAAAAAVTVGERDAKSAAPFRALVVCPKSVVPNWESETTRFAPSLVVAPLAGRAVPDGANLVVVNYAQLRLAAPALQPVAWDAVILDEGQNIKNPQSQTAKVARELRAAHRIVLTGTPIENRALDLWSLFAFAMPGLLGTQAAFARGYNEKTDPAGARVRLARRVKHFLLRRTKAQVASDLPPRTEEDLVVELEGEQRRLYDAELKRARTLLRGVGDDRALGAQRFNILQSLLRLRQICCDPRLVGFAESVAPGPSRVTGSAKLEALLDTLEPLVAEGHRVLVFSQFVSALELIATELKSREIGFLTLTGQTENRQELVEQFQSAEGPPVFLLSLKAAGAGLNLTAASYVVLFDPWWNPAVEAQAIDRTHRIGQRNAVIAYRLIAKGTIEEKIRQLQRAKADLARAIVQEETLATVLNLDDLRFILGEESAS